jgi:hypothetical protein
LWDYLFHLATGLSVQVWIDNHGLVRRVEGVDRIIDSLAKRYPGTRSIVRAYLEDYISSAAIKDELNPLFAFVPARTKLAGQSWVVDLMLMSKAPVQLSNIYTMEKLAGDTAFLSVSSIISARQGEQGRVYMKGRLSGNIVTSYSTGIPYQYQTTDETITTTDMNTITSRNIFTAVVMPLPE